MRLLQAGRLARITALALLSVTVVTAQDRPLPDQDAFLREVRAKLRTDSSLQSSYIYTETRREQKLDDRGRVTQESVKVFESYPGLPGEERWERLIAEDGRPRPASELEKEMRDRQKKAEEVARQSVEQPAKLQARWQRDYAEQRRELDAILDDVMLVYDIRMERREAIEGHGTIVFSLTPRPSSKPRTREGKQMRSFIVRAWVSE